jgi:hypothetical protein
MIKCCLILQLVTSSDLLRCFAPRILDAGLDIYILLTKVNSFFLVKNYHYRLFKSVDHESTLIFSPGPNALIECIDGACSMFMLSIPL